MVWHKRLELWAKLLLTLLASLLLWRPGRRRAPSKPVPLPERVLLVRIDDRVGEALLTTPLLTTLKAQEPRVKVHVLVHRKVARVLTGHPAADEVIAFDRRRLWLGAWAPGIVALRRRRYALVIDCANWDAPSVTSALVSRLVGPRAVVVGPGVWPVSLLQSSSVEARADTRSEVLQRLHLLSGVEGFRPDPRLSFREPAVTPPLREFLDARTARPLAVVNPGGRLGWRRIRPEAFAAAARALIAAGRTPIITWGPGEEQLAASVAALAPGAHVAPATNLDELAALMRAAQLTICNNTGPMHLSVALGVPTLGLFYRMELDRWGHPTAPHRMVDLTPYADAGDTLEAFLTEQVRSFAASAPRGA